MKKSRQRISLLNGCSCSQISVHPSNWNDAGAKTKDDWYIFYRFYDPAFKDHPKYKNGKLVPVKGMNHYKTLTERRKETIGLLQAVKEEVLERGWNPITKVFMQPEVTIVGNREIAPHTPLDIALQKALDKKKCSHNTKIDLKSVRSYFIQAAKQLKYDKVPVNQIKRSHVLAILEQCGEIKKEKWTANNFNHYRSHIMMLFEVLVIWCTIEHNPVEKIPVEQVVRRKRTILTTKQRIAIDSHLRAVNYPFWLHMHIFFLAGCRRAELLRVQGKKVDLVNQKFTVLRMKGRKHVEVEYTIVDSAVPLWEMALVGCRPEDYVFSEGLKPGPNAIRPEQVTRRWKRWVKDAVDENDKKLFGDEIADFYALKHLQTTSIAAKHGTSVAAAFNNESEAMIIQHYDVGHEAREHEKSKGRTKSFT